MILARGKVAGLRRVFHHGGAFLASSQAFKMSTLNTDLSSETTVQYEKAYSAHNYHPLPVVFQKAKGAKVWDPEGKQYLDFLSAYSAVNQGHCHPDIIAALVDQASKLTLSSRAFSNNVFSAFAKFITEYFRYESVLPMNTGAEAVETGLKLARRWGYMKKGIPENEAIILGAKDNFHGRTLGALSLSTDEEARKFFGPFLESITAKIPGTDGQYLRYGNIEDVELAFKNAGDRIAAILLEPIQGEAGIVVPPVEYLQKVQELCRKYNVLLICDEIQTGIARTGKMLCYEHSPNVKPDVILLGKAISGGILPVSCVLSSKEIMGCFEPGSHGSTYGGNPLSSRVAIAALEVVKKENLVERAKTLGEFFQSELKKLQQEAGGIISDVRGRGLLTAIVIDPSKSNGRTAWDLCLLMKDQGVLAKPTHDHIIRLAPPLVISKEDLMKGVEAIRASLKLLPNAAKSNH
ncbi:ornithine aminotransferase [Lachancea thermotolerans CBS 6340]|uniref:Ornithine aminotransferase n=1 Tax=Lachancea thermotolerans (strain ATCC 56472 / CBS 6340 / NRRL Y-8284) TaxID=559295 RepID=C5DC59_LACTC|nr:KLTH0B00220p [Lachancea thermotolerans CBS 6340]CAR21369.1 KLTH0B00220p [Lachancea thermotolerans CBS 6340]